MPIKKIVDECQTIAKKRGNGLLRREVWVDEQGRVTRYNLAYINHDLFQGDNGRVIGYDNAHARHHRHVFGTIEPVSFVSFEEIEQQFEDAWMASRSQIVRQLIVRIANEENFFQRGRRLARLADQGLPLPEEQVISFEDPACVLQLLSVRRLSLFRAIKQQPGAVGELARRLKRDRRTVLRDVHVLADAGMLRLETQCLPGRQPEPYVSVTAARFRLEACMD